MVVFIAKLIRRFKEHDLYALSCQLTYNLILSFFPFLMCLLTIIGYSKIDSTVVLKALRSIMPSDVYTLTSGIVQEVLAGGRIELLSFSIIGTIWASSSGFRAVIKGLNKAYETDEDRPYIETVIMSIFFVIGFIIVLVVAFGIIVFGENLGSVVMDYLKLPPNFKWNWNILRYLISLFILFIIMSAIYYIVPCRKMTVKEVIPGALLSSLGFILSSQIISYYVTNINNYTRIYGGLGVVIILLLWLFTISFIILLGGEINAVLVEE
ncbi:membrane protein [Hathewaya proteolytica DSM 3090]|uniref:Membrane protein n=1 Tax=Hathewaya proteolytica DSM 3090 TaxID=1121331 RepID=A0A1M6NDW9_9CLOT|nr:YihY/virulence factor BrkB family protein [Hathewaya proteolytica]SHJ93843.1 membrane protein [Hathewaya proteolytica DSM 3090]